MATHKKFNDYKITNYVPIQVGAALTNNRFGYLSDDQNYNISKKNRNYCELTALYWAWKNSSANIKGLCHYRRYLSTKDVNIDSKYFLSSEIIKQDLEKYDMVTSYKRLLKGRNCKENYLAGQGIEKDLINLQRIIYEKHPDYEKSYDDILNGNECIYCNVMISNHKLFDAYCAWLFDLLFSLEEITDLSGYTPAQARIYGYLSEILLNVWIDKNCLKVKHYSLINTEVKKNNMYYMKLAMEQLGLYKSFKRFKREM